ncbi:MAG: carboxypeptidase-like regulatory domain-containing protein [Kofleriaceae bacterium]
MKHVAALLFLVACGGGGSSPNNGGGGDDDGSNGTTPDAAKPAAQMLKFSGVTQENTQSGATPLAGVTMALYANGSDSSPLGMATSDASGNYSFSVDDHGAAIDGYMKASKSGYVDNFIYPAAAFSTDQTAANANLVTTDNFNYLGLLGSQQSGKGLVVVEILDSSDQSVAGATLSSMPAAGSVKYMDNGIPTGTSGTDTDGAAFLFNVPPGSVTISAAKSGMTFKSHALTAHADAFTTTVIGQ